jgi:membrane protein YdbS with pleckstrin-like domain
MILLVVAVLVVIALHLGLVGTIVANSRWTDMATNVVLALIALKVVLVALVRRRRTTKTPDEM